MIDLFLCHIHLDTVNEGTHIYLPSKPFHCEAGSGLIFSLASAVWKTSDFVVFS